MIIFLGKCQYFFVTKIFWQAAWYWSPCVETERDFGTFHIDFEILIKVAGWNKRLAKIALENCRDYANRPGDVVKSYLSTYFFFNLLCRKSNPFSFSGLSKMTNSFRWTFSLQPLRYKTFL